MILTATALIRDGNTFLVSSIVERGCGGGDDVPASSSSSLSFELSRSLRFCLWMKVTTKNYYYYIMCIDYVINGVMQLIKHVFAYDKK